MGKGGGDAAHHNHVQRHKRHDVVWARARVSVLMRVVDDVEIQVVDVNGGAEAGVKRVVDGDERPPGEEISKRRRRGELDVDERKVHGLSIVVNARDVNGCDVPRLQFRQGALVQVRVGDVFVSGSRGQKLVQTLLLTIACEGSTGVRGESARATQKIKKLTVVELNVKEEHVRDAKKKDVAAARLDGGAPHVSGDSCVNFWMLRRDDETRGKFIGGGARKERRGDGYAENINFVHDGLYRIFYGEGHVHYLFKKESGMSNKSIKSIKNQTRTFHDVTERASKL